MKDWVEDAAYENGKYVCMCFACKKPFVGHKRRVICRECVRGDSDACGDGPGVIEK